MSIHSTFARQQQIFKDIQEERDNQDDKWGSIQSREDNEPWLQILVEEVGEVAEAQLKEAYDPLQSLRKELIQVAAVAVAWIEKLDLEP